MKKSIFNIFKSPIRIVILLISLSCLSFPLYFYKVATIKNQIIQLLSLTEKTYVNAVQVVEVLGWSLFIGVFSQFFWQIKSHEYKKFLPITGMGAIIIFIYTVCRQAKDAMLFSVVSAETVTFAKILVIVINAIYFSFYYTKLTRKSHYRNFLLIAMLPIIGYYILYNFVLFENPAVIPSAEKVLSWNQWIANNLPGVFGPLMKHLIALFSKWPVTLYYILSEIFSVAVLSTVFWKLANRFVTPHERPRFYPAIMIASQIASFASGMFTTYICKSNSQGYAPILNKITILVCILSVILVAINWFFFSKVVHDDEDSAETKSKTKISMGIWQIIKENPKYFFVAMLTVYYGFCSVFMEQFWKNTIRMAYPNPADYGNFTGNYIIIQSRIALVFTMFISNFCMNYCSWFLFASLTPLLTIIGSGLLFTPMIFQNTHLMSTITSISPSLIVCALGVYVVGLFKSVKYGSFDPSKEEFIAQRAVADRVKIKFLEAVIGKVGKSGGAVLLALLFGLTNLTYQSQSVAVGLCISTILMGVIWFMTVISINKDVHQREKQ